MQPIKVWNADRTNRRCVVASSLNDLKQKAAEKLGYQTNLVSQLKLVLENDGTLIENDETLMRHTASDQVFLLLRSNEKWIAPALGIFKNAMCAIPEVITDALRKLELMDKPPMSWKLIDNKGNITVVLHWDHRLKQQQHQMQTRRAIASTTTSNLLIEKCGTSSTNSSRPNSGLGQWTFDIFPNKIGGNKKIQDSNLLKSPGIYSKQIPRLNGLDVTTPQLGSTPAISMPEMLNAFDEDEDFSEEIINSTLIKELISPSQEFAKCDFHCASLHRAALKPNILRSTATSPIPEILRNTPPPIISVTNEEMINNRPISPASTLIKKPKDIQKQHVRFLDDHKYEKDENNNRRLKQSSIPEADEETSPDENDKNEKNKELNKESTKKDDEDINQDENQEENLHERYLLLIDQLGDENGSHLSIKDIGIILDKMSSKIVDVDKLEKEKENDKANNWLIKATVKGDFVSSREIGIIYNGCYYGIIEHPSYF